ncbi:WD repeat-containing protein 55 homolog [Aphidius gifuensis]|nr:WD repeat-containing protein 55 homolog [Aphidius gifuensis]
MREGDKKWRVQVEAESMEYDHIVGKLIQCTEEWTKPDPKNHDVKLEFVNDLPINSDQPTILDSETNQYVIPSMSDDWKDAGQSVLPFMDAQTIGCSPEAPLGGIGLHHRGVAKDSEDSGFLGLTAHTVNYASYLKQSAEKYAEARKRQKEEEDDEDDDDDDDDGDGDDDDDDDDEDEDDDDDDEDDDDDD